jgi:hypothetical protein
MADVGLVVRNAFNDAGVEPLTVHPMEPTDEHPYTETTPEPLTVFLSVHEEGASQQFFWVDNNHVVSSGRTFRWVRCGFRIRMFISRFHRVK